jgi:uncharacterized protein YbjT (DUF2867 family)
VTPDKLVLVTGATGYVGGRLVSRLLELGYHVRVLVRDPGRLDGRSWLDQVDIVKGDMLSMADLNRAMQYVSTAYYLVHNMKSGREYSKKEINSGQNFAAAAATSGIDHIIYLGGLADPNSVIGSHMRSRIQTGEMLRRGSVPVTEFRASMIIGSGSISFEMIRYLTEQLPVSFSRRWIQNCTQAISIQNVLDYLILALENQSCRGKIYEIGGKDVLTYAATIQVYARLRGLRRFIIVMPWVPVSLMAFIAGKLSPVPASIAAPLLEGMRSDSVVNNDLARRDFPTIELLGYQTSVEQALSLLSPLKIEIALENGASSFRIKQQGFFIECQRKRVEVQPGAAYRAITDLGGENGWLYMNWFWRLRGGIDKQAGGAGLRGREGQSALVEGDILDVFRVELLEPERRMLLKSELKAPGEGWMEWRILPKPGGEIALTQIVYFAPRGVAGFLYWYLLLPVHRLVFSGLIKAICRRAELIQKEFND